jgi:hypothetical protein
LLRHLFHENIIAHWPSSNHPLFPDSDWWSLPVLYLSGTIFFPFGHSLPCLFHLWYLHIWCSFCMPGTEQSPLQTSDSTIFLWSQCLRHPKRQFVACTCCTPGVAYELYTLISLFLPS